MRRAHLGIQCYYSLSHIEFWRNSQGWGFRVSGEALVYYLVSVLQRYTLARVEPHHSGRLLDFIVLYQNKTIIRSKDSSPNCHIEASQVMDFIMEWDLTAWGTFFMVIYWLDIPLMLESEAQWYKGDSTSILNKLSMEGSHVGNH